jgi:putative endonuclease
METDNKKNNKTKGNFGEQIAKKYLLKKGYAVLQSNFRAGKIGEIDIIAQNGNCLIFAEVKYRQNLNYGYPSEALNSKKIKKIHMVVNIYLNMNKIENKEMRFDVIEIMGKHEKYVYINHIENAF